MFGLLSSSQIYGLQQAHDNSNSTKTLSAPLTTIAATTTNTTTTTTTIGKKSLTKHRRPISSLSDSGKETNKFFSTLTSMQNIKTPTNFIEKFIKTELLNSYDTLKNYTNLQYNNHINKGSPIEAVTTRRRNHPNPNNQQYRNSYTEGILTADTNSLHGSYRTNCDSEFYETVNFNNNNNNNNLKNNKNNNSNSTNHINNKSINNTRHNKKASTKKEKSAEMTIKCSKNLLVEPTHQQTSATLQNYQKLPECEINDILPMSADGGIGTSGASSGEYNSNSDINNSSTATVPPTSSTLSLYKKLSFGRANTNNKNVDTVQTQMANDASDNSSSSLSTSTHCSSSATTTKSNDLQRTSSASSSGDCTLSSRERKKSNILNTNMDTVTTMSNKQQLSPERAQRRKLLQMISNYDQQNKLLQRELAKEKRRRTEELACVVKSLLCFESKLKTDMKSVNQRMQEKDIEICRLVRLNRALKKQIGALQIEVQEKGRDEGVVEDGDIEADDERKDDAMKGKTSEIYNDLEGEDCLVLEALQCINCRKQFYDIDMKEEWSQQNNQAKDNNRNNDDPTTEHGSSSDDTVSSSFYGARRSVRYTSKRTSGTFRDYMRSRSMNIDDPSLDNNSEENTSTISRDDSQTSYEKMNVYSRMIERMHGVKCENDRADDDANLIIRRSCSRLSNKSSSSSKTSSEKSSPQQMEEDDGIFSPTQDDDFEEDIDVSGTNRTTKILPRRSMDFSEQSPKQVYETSTDDWYASASDQEEIISATTASKSYGHGAINPVLECVNQILLQQSMEESVHDTTHSLLETSNLTTVNETINPYCTPPKSANHLQVNGNIPRRSSLSGRRSSSRSNSHSSEGQSSRNGTLTRKRVHFSTKNSMVHVPRNDEHTDEDDVNTTEMISNRLQQQQQQQSHYHPMNFYSQNSTTPSINTASVKILVEVTPEQERLETLNYESIYSNEYEPIIGSEHNGSNLYVDMESTKLISNNITLDTKLSKLPPALPPKPANLLKFKKSLQQLDEVPDEQHELATSEPDYCSISEVNVNITSVQIVADVHHKAESEAEHELQSLEGLGSELDIEVSTVVSDETCAASQKTEETEEVEEIFADIPKLPNVAAIIAPKMPKYKHQQHLPQQQQQHEQQQKQNKRIDDYLIMSPKVETTALKTQNARKLMLTNNTTPTKTEFMGVAHTPITKVPKMDATALKLQLLSTPSIGQQYKRKHVPNILAEINKRISLPNSPTTPTAATPTLTPKLNINKNKVLFKNIDESSSPNLPLQAEFDWYNLDAEYGKAPHNPPDLLKVNDCLNGTSLNVLADITEDHESIVTTADEYNLDEEFSLLSEKPTTILEEPMESNTMDEEDEKEVVKANDNDNKNKFNTKIGLNVAICEAVNFPIFGEASPMVTLSQAATLKTQLTMQQGIATKAKKIKKNLANFEKFIEGSGLSTKPLPSKRKIYFAGPFV